MSCSKLHEIVLELSDKLLSFCKTRKEDTVRNRLYVGYSYLTRSFILNKESPACVSRNTIITVNHRSLLIECVDLVEVRKKYF